MVDTVIEPGPGDRSRTVGTPAGAAALAEHARRTLVAIERATERLRSVAGDLDEVSVHRPSLLPGWTRAHVLSHLARNADGCVNLLRWARTGVEHPMYASRADRDADIAEGALRGHSLLLEDLDAASERLAEAARSMPDSAWSAEVLAAPGKPIPAHEILRNRLLEVWVHLADLDFGFRFDDIPVTDAEQLLEDAVQQLGGRPDVPAVSVSVDFGEHRRDWELRGTTSKPPHVAGPPGAMLGWLLGRTDGTGLTGDLPELPVWL